MGASVRLAVTVGDVRGIGPEITAKACRDERVRSLVEAGALELLVVAPDGSWEGARLSSGTYAEYEAAMAGRDKGGVGGRYGRGGPGTSTAMGGTAEASSVAAAGRIAGRGIELAARMALRGEVDGIVTAPIDKYALFEGGYDFPGHTEMLGHLAGVRPAMMLASGKLRVILVTTHIPLRDVVSAVTRDAIAFALITARTALERDFGISAPRIALCALNPHAGDRGRFGSEDAEILAPVAREHGALGPFPADTVFVRAMRGEFDAVVAPYHDVGMTAIKVASFGSAVNVTLGLPFPRTSPDHGTAMDIAGKGIASPDSMTEAILLCHSLASRRLSSRFDTIP